METNGNKTGYCPGEHRCMECGEPLGEYGRSDRKFCSPHCKDGYNNRKRHYLRGVRMRVETALSVTLTRSSGHSPVAESERVATARVMAMEVSGKAKRFVIRKYGGKERKRSQARGAVKAWQEMERDAAFHIFAGRDLPPSREPASGHRARSFGWSTVIPAMAR